MLTSFCTRIKNFFQLELARVFARNNIGHVRSSDMAVLAIERETTYDESRSNGRTFQKKIGIVEFCYNNGRCLYIIYLLCNKTVT